MPKVTLDMNTFRALASDTRLDILRTLDGKKMSLTDICRATKLNKATLHEHLTKLNGAGLIKKNEREGHKWVYYKLTWKGEGLLHPENTRIVVMFSITFISLLLAVMLMVNFVQPITVGMAETVGDATYLYEAENIGIPLMKRSYNFNYLGEIDAKEKTVGNITTELQIRASPRNNIGATYADGDIDWYKVDSEPVSAAPECISLSPGSGGSIDIKTYDISSSFSNYEPIKTSQVILYPVYDINISSIIDLNISTNKTELRNNADDKETNEYFLKMIATLRDPALLHFAIKTKGSNTTDDNGTKELSLGLKEGGSLVGYSPAVPNMIATVQDSTLLYFAVACLTFFVASFTLSTWRLWVNKTQKI